MAEAALFIGWGAPISGREATGLEIFNESVEYWGRLQQEGRIESFEVVLLYPYGGDLRIRPAARKPRAAERRRWRRRVFAPDDEGWADSRNLGVVTGRPRRRAGPPDRALPAGRRRTDLRARGLHRRPSCVRQQSECRICSVRQSTISSYYECASAM